MVAVKEGQLGREAYLAKEAAKYDRHFAQPHSIVLYVIVCLALIGICVAPSDTLSTLSRSMGT